jgi:putative N6-adenine-specific DNA methylase
MVKSVGNVLNVGIIVNKGFEKAAVVQVREILEGVKDITVQDTLVSFKPKTWDEVYRFVYKNQIANRIIYIIGEFDYANEDELIENTDKLISTKDDELLKNLILGGVDFRVSVKIDEHTDVTGTEADIGGILFNYAKTLGTELKVNLKSPSLNLYVYLCNNHAYIGIDLSDDISKRDYKIFNNAVSLKGPTAFGLLMLAGYKPGEVYLNPCCYSGTIEIEAALYSTQLSHRFYNKSFPFMKFPINADYDWEKFFKIIDAEQTSDKTTKEYSITGSDKLLSSITAAIKNAKIAGVESIINFRRIDFDWMDIKFEEKAVDKIITFVPGSSKHDKHIVKDFKQIFYQAEYILKKSGKLVIMCLSKDLLIQCSNEHFDVDHEVMVHSGGQTMYVLFFKKKMASKEKVDKIVKD